MYAILFVSYYSTVLLLDQLCLFGYLNIFFLLFVFLLTVHVVFVHFIFPLRIHVHICFLFFFFFSSRRRHTRCALVTGVQTCALPICQYLSNLSEGQKVEDVEPQVMEIVRAHFRPEFLNRLDEIILFHRLAAEHMGPIVDIQVGRVQNLLKDRKVTLDLTDGARAWLGRVGYDPVYGARPLKRAVQKYLQDPLADMILRGDVPDGSTISVDEGDGALILKAA